MSNTLALHWRTWERARAVLLVALFWLPAALAAQPALAQGYDASISRIVGGTRADPQHWRFIVSLRGVDVGARRLQYFCGGALIAPRWVVTAAHCVEGWASVGGQYRNRYGVIEVVSASADLAAVDGENVFQVNAVFIHPEYGGRITHRNDIALIHLAAPAGEGIPVARTRPTRQIEAEVAGFGRAGETGTSASATLRSGFLAVAGSIELLSVEVAPRTGCGAVYPEFDGTRQLCFGIAGGGRDSCQGDSGGPLVVRNPEPLLIGVVSYGRGCARPDAPGVYVALDAYWPWLEIVMANDALRADPRDLLALRSRGNAYYAQEAYGRAIADYTEILRLSPLYWEVYEPRANAHYALGEYDSAIADYGEAIRAGSPSAHARYNRGRIYLAHGEIDAAIVDFDDAIRLDPHLMEAFQSRGNARYAREEYPLALTDFDEAVRLAPEDSGNLYGRGAARSMLGDYAHAIEDYSEALRVNNRMAMAYDARAGAHRAVGRMDQSLTDYDRAVSLEPDNALFRTDACRARAIGPEAGFTRGLSDCDAAVRLAPADPVARSVRAFFHLRRGAFAVAIADYDVALDVDPTRPGSLYGRGVARVGLGQIETGRADIAAGIALDPTVADEFAQHGVTPP